jgi:predicted phosphodiesterase
MHTVHHKQEFHIENLVNNILPEEPQDVLLIAGDIGHSNKQNAYMLKLLGKIYKKVIVTFGNHDYYLVSKTQQNKYFRNSFNRVQEMKAKIDDIENVYVSDGEIIEHDGVKYSGTDMWYDGKLSNFEPNLTEDQIKEKWLYFMNDANYIYNMKSYKFILDEEIAKLEKNIENVDVFLSHVGPVLPKNIPAKYDDTNTRFFFFDGMKYLTAKAAPKIWVFGHTHEQYDFRIEKTDIICNPLGYPSENVTGHKKIRNIEIHHWED